MIGTRTYEGISQHLDHLWVYGCEAYRLLGLRTQHDPFWTLIMQDVKVQVEADPLIERVEYRRYRKTAMGFSGKNCEMFLGQFISLIARERIPGKKRRLSPPTASNSGT